jgi:hypothetical protein
MCRGEVIKMFNKFDIVLLFSVGQIYNYFDYQKNYFIFFKKYFTIQGQGPGPNCSGICHTNFNRQISQQIFFVFFLWGDCHTIFDQVHRPEIFRHKKTTLMWVVVVLIKNLVGVLIINQSNISTIIPFNTNDIKTN